MKKLVAAGTLLMVMCLFCYAQPGIAELGASEQTLRSWFGPFMSFILALSAIFFLISGYKIFTLWNLGGLDNVPRSLLRWFGGIVFITLVSGTLKILF